MEVWVTGLGMVSSLGEGAEAYLPVMAGNAEPVLDAERFAPYIVHPLKEPDFSEQVPKRGDLRQMGRWQQIGVYAAGLALNDAGLKSDAELLSRTHLIVAAGNGERDMGADTAIIEASAQKLNEVLQTELRPTLYLAELSNLLAGNISIVHKVVASSRTFKGEEMAGVSALENAVRRINAGDGELFLVGGACNSEREDLLLAFELGHKLERTGNTGMKLGSLGAFLLLESKEHALARGAQPYARVDRVMSNNLPDSIEDELPVLSGVTPVRTCELAWLEQLGCGNILKYGEILGHSLEAHFPAGMVLAALSMQEREFLGKHAEKIMVTGFGHLRGEGAAILSAV
jgi:3-oxoacyl-[acyl-carrier-protein] synthase II